MDFLALEQYLPEVIKQLTRVQQLLECRFKNMQEIEFAVQEGELYILCSRDGRRAPQASTKIAVSMVLEGLLTGVFQL